jgi:hypothetical protein
MLTRGIILPYTIMIQLSLLLYISNVKTIDSIILNSNAYYHQVVLTSIFAIKTRYIVTLCLPRNVATRMGV